MSIGFPDIENIQIERNSLGLYLLIGVPLLALVAFFILPLLNMIYLSFLEDMPPASVTLENYQTIINPPYTEIIWRSLVLAIQTTILVVVFGYSLAYSIVRFSTKTTIFLLLIILPFWTNYLVRMYAWILLLQNNGVISSVLNTLNLTSGAWGALYSQEAVLVGLVYAWLPLAILPFYASLSNMDTDLIDAAKDLGAGPIKAFFTVTIPCTYRGIVAGVVLVAIPAFGAFLTPQMLGGTDAMMIGNVIDRQFNQSYNWPFGAAAGVFIALFVIAAISASALLGSSILERRRIQ